MEALTYIIVTIVVMAVCFIGLGIGVIIRNKGFRTCGQAAMTFNGEEIACPACGGHGKKGNCSRKSQGATPAHTG